MSKNDIEADSSQVILRDKSLLSKSKSKVNHLDDLIESEHKVNSLNELDLAVHVIIVNGEYYCHALIESIDVANNSIEIIYYEDQSQTQCTTEWCRKSGLVLSESESKSSRNVGVKKSRVDFKRVDVYKVAYDVGQSLSPDETLEKASEFNMSLYIHTQKIWVWVFFLKKTKNYEFFGDFSKNDQKSTFLKKC